MNASTMNTGTRTPISWTKIAWAWIVLAALTAHDTPAFAQTFDSTSTGEDGALDFADAEPGTTIIFDPTTYNPPLDRDGDGIYHFTTISIPESVTVRLSSRVPSLGSRPVYWLASGRITIGGVLDLDGEDGADGAIEYSYPSIACAGAGGYNGGLAGTGNDQYGKPGSGPGGGGDNIYGRKGAGHLYKRSSSAYGNTFLLPLLGGSGGGGGGHASGNSTGGGGGAGGGALLLVSSEVIIVNGRISARGGAGGQTDDPNQSGGGGSGGSIRLVAPKCIVNGKILASGGGAHYPHDEGSPGRIRIECFERQVAEEINPVPQVVKPGKLYLPQGHPTIRVTSVGGISVSTSPTADYESPDIVVDGETFTFEITASNIPAGTILNVHVYSEGAEALTVSSTPLEGSLEESTATAEVPVPPGFALSFVRATW